jgi:hypothetical protein
MAAGWPTKVSYANGDVFSASDINDTNGTINYIDPTSATDNQVLTRDAAAPGKVKWATPSAGKILQVIFATDNTVTSNSTTTYADTSLSATITPANSSNKVLVLVATVVEKNSGNQNNAVKYRLMRGATQIQEMQYLAYTFTAITNVEGLSMTYLDSPATTSATTYKTQIANQAAFAAVNDNPGGATATTMVLMEVAP